MFPLLGPCLMPLVCFLAKPRAETTTNGRTLDKIQSKVRSFVCDFDHIGMATFGWCRVRKKEGSFLGSQVRPFPIAGRLKLSGDDSAGGNLPVACVVP